RGTVQRTLKPDAVKNLPEFYGATSLQGVRTEQDVTEWVEHFISYMETQKVTATHDICHYAFLSLTGEAHALATSLRQADTATSTDVPADPFPLQRGGDGSLASAHRAHHRVKQQGDLLTAHGVNSANFMPPQHGSDSSPSADYIDDDPSLNSFSNFDDNQFFDSYSNFDDDAASFNVYGNLNNSNRNGSGRRTYRDTRQSDNSRSQRAPTRQGGNSAQRFAPSAGAASAHAPSHDHRQQRSRRCRRHYRSTPAANFEAARKTHTASPTAAVSTTLPSAQPQLVASAACHPAKPPRAAARRQAHSSGAHWSSAVPSTQPADAMDRAPLINNYYRDQRRPE
ncbi:hypothetical protein JKP88DRAFT_256194, partial [Tribonema minus]